MVLYGIYRYFDEKSEKEAKVKISSMYENVVVDQLLTTEQLCKRWGICKTTLHTWEKNGIISLV